ncbi:adhesin [Proteus myxofaciens]|uniref:Adhesin n=1 Tax=Proteus myxofaciens ATCC 19692 TaxID=1354337 RepID=A0A198GP82_9GAMM|nr:adhesin [Proteus myxofaciens]OAT38670.1 hypothetical protein M983_0214 [Proteus myxofaciens ATCC 19692]
MFPLKKKYLTNWWRSLEVHQSLIRQNKKQVLLISQVLLGCLLFPSVTEASYAGKIVNSNDGYRIALASNTSIASAPVVGSDGRNYYRVGEPIVVNQSSSSVVSSGQVNCMGRTWGNSTAYLPVSNVWHRLFIYSPSTGITLNGKRAYRINNNLIMTVESEILNWNKLSGLGNGCSTAFTGIRAITNFTQQFPFTITFFINDRIIDGQVVIPAMDLGGYVRAFTSPDVAPPYDTWPIEESTAPMRLTSSTLNLVAACNTTTSSGQATTLNLRHNQLSTLNYNDTVTETITYNCKFSMPTKVRLRLDYATDGDAQKRLPLINSQDSTSKIYSDLTMTHEASNQTGKDFKIDIEEISTVKISSHIQGTNAMPGDYKGSAWLIATFD